MVQVQPTYAQLLELARHIRAAVIAGDDASLHSALCGLRNALIDHVQAEHDEDRSSPSGPAQLTVVDGDRRLLRLVDDVLTNRDSDDGCNCVARAAEVEAAILRQARLEMVTVGRPDRNGAESSTMEHGP